MALPFVWLFDAKAKSSHVGKLAVSVQDIFAAGLNRQITVTIRRNVHPRYGYAAYSPTLEDVTDRCRYADERRGYVVLYKRDENGRFYLNEWLTAAETETVWGIVDIKARPGSTSKIVAKLQQLRMRACVTG
jgi:hypothetical protein